MTHRFFVQGVPAPGGSKTFFPVWKSGGQLVTEIRNGRVWPIIRVTDAAGERNKHWKTAVTLQGRSYMRGMKPHVLAIQVEFVFFMPRPKAHYRTGKFAHMLREDAPALHTQAPDALKLARSTEDALTGVLWHDDSSNVKISSEKRWAKAGELTGCSVAFALMMDPDPSGAQ